MSRTKQGPVERWDLKELSRFESNAFDDPCKRERRRERRERILVSLTLLLVFAICALAGSIYLAGGRMTQRVKSLQVGDPRER